MAVYRCSVCGYVYDEEKEGRPFTELKECPVCKQPPSKFETVSEEKSKPEAKPVTGDLAYDERYVRHDASCRYMEEIHEMAVSGKSVGDAMSTKMPVPG